MPPKTPPKRNMKGKNEEAAGLLEALMPGTSSDSCTTREMAALSLEPSPVACSEIAAMTRRLEPADYTARYSNQTTKSVLKPLPRNTSSDEAVAIDKHVHGSEGDIDLNERKPSIQSESKVASTSYEKHFLGSFHKSGRERLLEFVTNIRYEARNSGVFLKDGLVQPSSGMYREQLEFDVIKQLHHSSDVLLCRDKATGEQFVLKTVLRSKIHDEKLVGIEFLVKNFDKDFLLDVYAVYKDLEHFYIFEQYLGDCTVRDCRWNIGQVYEFLDALLKAVQHLHDNDVVHFDIKPMNIMVLDHDKPESLVLIDFESAKSKTGKLHMGGYTLVFLPPWHEALLSLENFDSILMSGDLWAVACVVMMFLQMTEQQDLNTWIVWRHELEKIQRKCRSCKICMVKDTSECHCKCSKCKDCKDNFLEFLKEEGHRVLEVHLGRLMKMEIQDPTLKRLIEVLKYLTDTANIEEKSTAEALRILSGD